MELLLIQLFIFISYITFIVSTYGVLPSISESWYRLPLKLKGLFTLFTWGIGIPMLFYGNETMFLSGAGLCFVGAATQFKMTAAYTRLIHYAGAGVGIILPLLYFAFGYEVYAPILFQIISAVLIMAIPKIDNKLWWIEIVGFLTIACGIYWVLPEMYYVGN